jgi:hypothetical protein
LTSDSKIAVVEKEHTKYLRGYNFETIGQSSWQPSSYGITAHVATPDTDAGMGNSSVILHMYRTTKSRNPSSCHESTCQPQTELSPLLHYFTCKVCGWPMTCSFFLRSLAAISDPRFFPLHFHAPRTAGFSFAPGLQNSPQNDKRVIFLSTKPDKAN